MGEKVRILRQTHDQRQLSGRFFISKIFFFKKTKEGKRAKKNN
jgi:hypothetical protein